MIFLCWVICKSEIVLEVRFDFISGQIHSFLYLEITLGKFWKLKIFGIKKFE